MSGSNVQRRRLGRLLLPLCLLYTIVGAAPAAAQTGLGVYEPGVEHQIWQQLSYVGAATCVPDDNTGQCTTPADTSLGKYYYPIQIATDVLSTARADTSCLADPRVVNYVTDQWNHRVQAFDYCGNPVPFPNAPNLWPTIGGGAPGAPAVPGGGVTGLNDPEGITVDAAHHIIVGDRDNSRVVIFNEDGSFFFEIPVPLGSQPTGVAVLPGTVMSPGGGNGWLAVTLSAYGMSRLQVYNSAGVLIGENPEPETTDGAPGGLGGPGGVTIDAAGRIYVADLYNSRINGYTVDTVGGTVSYQFTFGAPLDLSNLQPYELQNPYSVAIDRLGRVIVGDTGNQRLAVYSISFAPPASLPHPAVSYLFYLDARGDLNGYPRGAAQDRNGRLYVVDTTNHRVQRFEMPLIAVVNVSTAPAFSMPSGSLVTVSAGVVVPATKVAVVHVNPTIEATGATLVSGPAAVAPATGPPTPQIDAGQIAFYTWTYAADSNGATASFAIGATGDPNPLGPVSAPIKSTTVAIRCAGCESTAPVTTAAISSTHTSGIWRSSPVTVALTAVDGAEFGTPGGVRQIRIRLSGAQTSAGLELPQCSEQDGGNIEYCASAPPAPRQATFGYPISIAVDGTTTVWYRAVDNYGNIEAQHSVTVVVDGTMPTVTCSPTAAPNAYNWYGASTRRVTATCTIVDSASGLAPGTPSSASLVFAAEGITTKSVAPAADKVGNKTPPVPYSVQIDRTLPAITPVPARTVELSTAAGTIVTIPLEATDALSGVLNVTSNAPAMFALGTTSVTITATDYAGNIATAWTTVTVRDSTPPVITSTPPPVTLSTTPLVGTAGMPDLTGLVTATDLNGPMTFTQSIPAGTPLNPGIYTITLTATDRSGNTSTTTTAVTVRDLTPPVITACALAVTVTLNQSTNLATVPNMTVGVVVADTSGGPFSIAQSPAAGTTLGVGTYPVTITVADPSANTASCQTALTVITMLPPSAAIALTPGVLWPPNHRMVRVTAKLEISDPNATVQLVSITSTEPDNGLGDGDKPIDVQTLAGKPISTAYGIDTRAFQLRAERSGSGPGRVYTITYRVTNAAGSTLVAGVVLAPHDMSGDNDHFPGDECDGDHDAVRGQIGDAHYPGDGHHFCWANQYPALWRAAYQSRH